MSAPPDPRDLLANERTFLAWVRTSLGLLAAAAAVAVLGRRLGGWWEVLVAVLLAVLAVAVVAYGAWSWRRNERAILAREPLPPVRAPWWVAVVVGVAAVVLVVGVLVTS